MKRKVLAFLSAFVLFGSSSTFAMTDDGFFNAINSFSKVQVIVDNKYVSDPDAPSFLYNNRTVVPLKTFAEALGAFVHDLGNDKIQIVKPNVNMVVSESTLVNNQNNKFSIVPFTAVSKGQKITPHIYYVIDNAPVTDKLYSKIVVLDPNNQEIYSTRLDVINTEKKGTGLVGIAVLNEITFKKTGNYKVQFLMKYNGDYIKVSQTLIKSN